MSTELQVAKSFQERMMDRIKESMGELLTDEELALLIKRGIDEVFFKDRIIAQGTYNTRTEPPLIHTMVKESLGVHVRAAVDEYIREHKEELIPIIEKQLSICIGDAIISAVTNKFSNDINLLQVNIMNTLRNG